MSILWLIGALTTADAVPVKMTQQGRLLDANGAAVTGIHVLTVRLYDDPVAGNLIWNEGQQVLFNNGYYAILIGGDPSNPLDDSLLSTFPLYLEVDVGGQGPIGIRQEVVSTPFARRASTAVNVAGGTVDAAEIAIGGLPVIDSSGSWVGPAISLSWQDIQNVPTDLADGDNDLLSGITCTSGQILGWTGTQWGCAADNGLTESEVEDFIVNGPLDLASGTTVGGLPILTEGDGDTLGDLSCQDGELAKWDMVLGAWACATDIDTDTDTDTVLSDSEVDAFVENGPLDMAAGSTLDGLSIVSSAGCGNGEVLTWNSNLGRWVCSGFNVLIDFDNDGVLAWNDCDDTDPTQLGLNLDADCDGIQTSDDCDDTDPNANSIYIDGDCDGILTADDCDDADPMSTAVSNDGDCDGILTADDCDDADSTSTSVAEDFDCDGILSAIDCNDADSSVTTAFAMDASCPAVSCLDIITLDPTATSNPYWLDHGAGAYLGYCYMSVDGGGWTLALKAYNGDGQNFYHSASHSIFEDSSTLNANSPSLIQQDFKSRAYFELSGSELLALDLADLTQFAYGNIDNGSQPLLSHIQDAQDGRWEGGSNGCGIMLDNLQRSNGTATLLGSIPVEHFGLMCTDDENSGGWSNHSDDSVYFGFYPFSTCPNSVPWHHSGIGKWHNDGGNDVYDGENTTCDANAGIGILIR